MLYALWQVSASTAAMADPTIAAASREARMLVNEVDIEFFGGPVSNTP